MKRLASVICAVALTSCTTVAPISATSNPVSSTKGEACYKNLFGFIPLSGNDVSIYKAAKAGGVKKIATVDRELFFSGIYNSSCTIVRGSK